MTLTSKRRGRILLVMRGVEARREIVGSTLTRNGFNITSELCPQRGLLALASDPTIRKIIIAGTLACTQSDDFLRHARKLNKTVIPLLHEACVSDQALLSLVS
ncbi:MAG: hypothetical protein AAB365_03600 [Patescibacteria group bacterium]